MKNRDTSPTFVQQDLFASPFIKYNRAVKLLVRLEPDRAEKALAEFEGLYRTGRKLDLEYRIIGFLRESESLLLQQTKRAELMLELWEEQMEQQWRSENNPEGLLSRLRKSYFKRVSTELAADDRSGSLKEEIFLDGTALLIMIRGGLWREAASLAAGIADISQRPGRIHGYHGDALYCMEQKEAARRSYLTAFFLDAGSVDRINLCDPEVRELLTEPLSFIEELDIAEGPWEHDSQWAAAIGMLYGIFRPETVLEAGQAARWKDVLHDEKSSPGPAFAAGIILSSQGMMRLEAVGIDISSVRKRMKEISPELFSVFMRA